MKLTNGKHGSVAYKNKTLKAVVISSIITAFLTGSIAVVAVSLTAKEIGFTSTNENWQVNNVEDAVNDLYVLGIEASNAKIYKLGEGRSFNIATIVGSENVDKYGVSNFLIDYEPPVFPSSLVWNSSSSLGSAYLSSSYTQLVGSYDESTGDLTITGGEYYLHISGHGKHTVKMTPTVYFLPDMEIITGE